MKKVSLVIIGLLFICSVQSQLLSEKVIKGLPSKEVYDIIVDKKGFIWAGHEFGISRYDGVSFTNFFHPNSNSAGITDLAEDNEGKIWFHNFSNQIFYIENERIHLLESYIAKNELAFFPKIAVYKDWLISTSNKGLFVCDTRNLQSGYIQFTQKSKQSFETSSLTVVSDNVILHGKKGWYRYNEKEGVNELKLKNDSAHFATDESLMIYAAANKDTVYFVSDNSKKQINKAILKNNELVIVDKILIDGYLNNISCTSTATWINTKRNSFTTNGHEKIDNRNLTKVLNDKEGNTWYASLSEGLKVKFSSFSNWERINFFETKDIHDKVRRVAVSKNNLVVGTENGVLYVTNKDCSKVESVIKVEAKAGSVENIFYIDHDVFLIGVSVGCYMLDIANKKLHKIDAPIFTLKTVAVTDSCIYIGSSSGLYRVPSVRGNSVFTKFAAHNNNLAPIVLLEGKDIFKVNHHRCRSVAYSRPLKELYCVFNDGLYKITDTGRESQYLHTSEKTPILNATWIATYNNSIYLSTVNNGVVFKKLQPGKATSFEPFLSERSGLKSNYVDRINIIKNHLWIYRNGSAQIYDLNTEKLLIGFKLPFQEELNILDVAELDQTSFVAADEGFFKIRSFSATPDYVTNAFLISAVADNRDTLMVNNARLSYDEQNIKFKIGVPFYYAEETIQIYYKLLKDGVEIVNNATVALQREIEFNTLDAGNYTFIASTKKNFNVKQIEYSFSIDEVWWKLWWFKLLLFVLIGFTIVMVVINIINAELTTRKVFYEKQIALQNERQRIGAEFHDDIGASISAMRLNIDMIHQKNQNKILEEDLSKLSRTVLQLSQKVREVIWSMNPENDSLEKLIYYIQPMANTLFENSNIDLNIILPETIPSMVIQGDKRRDIYLVIKEALHNIIKHSGATQAKLTISVFNHSLVVEISDNGKGLNLNTADRLKYKGYGISNMQSRIKKQKGSMQLNSENGTVLKIRIPI